MVDTNSQGKDEVLGVKRNCSVTWSAINSTLNGLRLNPSLGGERWLVNNESEGLWEEAFKASHKVQFDNCLEEMRKLKKVLTWNRRSAGPKFKRKVF